MFHVRDHFAADMSPEERAETVEAARKQWLLWFHIERNKYRPFRRKQHDPDETHHLDEAVWTGGENNGGQRRGWARKR